MGYAKIYLFMPNANIFNCIFCEAVFLGGDGYWECKSISVSVFSIVKNISVNGQWLRDGKKTIYEMSSNLQIPRYILTPAVADSYLWQRDPFEGI